MHWHSFISAMEGHTLHKVHSKSERKPKTKQTDNTGLNLTQELSSGQVIARYPLEEEGLQRKGRDSKCKLT